MNKDAVIVIRGELNWAKITGKARPHTGNPKYDKGPSWTVDVTPDEASRKLMKQHGIDGKLRDPKGEDERTETFLSLRHLENKADGGKNDPIKIVDVTGAAWDDRLIGNGSVADVKVKVKDYGSGSDKGTYIQAVRILKHVPYVSSDFAPLKSDDEFFATGNDNVAEEDTKGASPNADELDDDIPF